MQKKLKKIVYIILAVISLGLILNSPVTFEIRQVKHFVREEISQNLSKSDTSLGLAVNAAEDSGLVDVIVSQLPDRVSTSESYFSFYKLVSKYRVKKEITKADLHLHGKNKVQNFLNDLIVYLINDELHVHDEQIHQMGIVYQSAILIVAVLYLLAIALIIFDKNFSWLPLLVGSVASFGGLIYFVRCATSIAQNEVYSKMNFYVAWSSWAGFILAIILIAVLIIEDLNNKKVKQSIVL